ncbi:hypothetical protein ACE6H2_021557 [Prunus campanulata]
MSSTPDMAFAPNVQEIVRSDPSQIPKNFLVVNYGVATKVLQEMKDATAKFFELPLEEKNKIRMPSDDFQGYGQAFVASQRQTLDWSDALFLNVYPSHHRKLKFWPTSPEGFK